MHEHATGAPIETEFHVRFLDFDETLHFLRNPKTFPQSP
jgi:hypothetical protein